ncbi:SAM-dependent methyltransferase [Terrabacter sp. GCM10028922]|uniref:SAM-dependent methyltransferase n=1 Tax=Terrabacter sp. GCM10028922 TaxID=3273428 RepID=UPI0036231D0F
MDPVPWRDAWHEALYAVDRGFYVTRGGPAAHFTTAAHGPTGAVLARALLALPDHPVRVVVDLGAGRGELATHLVDALDSPDAIEWALSTGDDVEWALSTADERVELPTRPRGTSGRGDGRPRVVAVDVVDRPEGLDHRVEWLRSPGGPALPDPLHDLQDALVIAHEWLDVVPCTVAEVDPDGVLREVLVDAATGEESLGNPLSGADLRWAEQNWPTSEPGDRVEVGLSRDLAWADLVARVGSGTLVAVDYGHTASSRPSAGTLTAYAGGRLTVPVPDGSCDVTAHVAMDTLDADVVQTQREALRALGLRGATPPHELAVAQPLAYVAGLERASAEARLLDPAGFGGFWWAVKSVQRADVP